MGWLHLNKPDSEHFRQAISEIEDGSPRAVVICGACFVEDHLTDLIKTRLKEHPKITQEMFKPGAPLGDFGVKINLAYMMGICGQEAHQELSTIRGLRNDFAHKLEVNNFAGDSVRARCNNLKLWEEIKIKVRVADALKKGGSLALMMGRDLKEGEREAFLLSPPEPEESAIPAPPWTLTQDRYINACKFFIAACAISIHTTHKFPTPDF